MYLFPLPETGRGQRKSIPSLSITFATRYSPNGALYLLVVLLLALYLLVVLLLGMAEFAVSHPWSLHTGDISVSLSLSVLAITLVVVEFPIYVPWVHLED